MLRDRAQNKNQDLGMIKSDRFTQGPSSSSPKDKNIHSETNAAEIALDNDAETQSEVGLLHRQQGASIDTKNNGGEDEIPLSQEGHEAIENENLSDQPADLRDTETPKDFLTLHSVQLQNENQSTSSENSEVGHNETEVGTRKYDDNTHSLGTETQTELKRQHKTTGKSLNSTPEPNIDTLERNFTNFYKSMDPTRKGTLT